VRTFYPFAQVRSWENHGEFVIIEVSKKGEAKGTVRPFRRTAAPQYMLRRYAALRRV
jgi:hypothetical protein